MQPGQDLKVGEVRNESDPNPSNGLRYQRSARVVCSDV